MGIVVLYILGFCMQILFGTLKHLNVPNELLTYMIFVFSSIPILIASFLVSVFIKKPALKAIKAFFIFHTCLGLVFFIGGCIYILIRFVF